MSAAPPPMATCVHGVAFSRSDSLRWFEQETPCPECNAARRQVREDIEGIEARLRRILPAEDPLHPDSYHGPFGNLWLDAVLFLIDHDEAKRAKQAKATPGKAEA